MAKVTAEESWRRAVISPPFYISYVRLKPLTLGKAILLEMLGMSDVLTIGQFTHALYIVKQPTFQKASDAVEVWHPRLLLNFPRLWAWARRVGFQWTFHLINLGRNNAYSKRWREYIEISTRFPLTEMDESKKEDSLGLTSYGALRAYLVKNGAYRSSEIMDANLLQTLHDYAYSKGVRTQTLVDMILDAKLRKDIENAKSKR